MATIYISSTYSDLKEYRDAVHRLLAKVPGRAIHAMEDYVASDERPVELCLKDVAACDVYVGIFAWRYGFVPPKDNAEERSITEMEYRKATAEGKARLIFILDPSVAWTMDQTDLRAEDHGSRIDAFRQELGVAHTISYFKSADQLAGLVSAAVSKWEQEQSPKALPNPTPPPPASPVQVRELRNSLLLAFSSSDEELAAHIARICQTWLDRPLLLSKTALFAHDEPSFGVLEENATRSSAALVLLTPTCIDQLKGQTADVGRVLTLLQARTGAAALLLAGLKPGQVPFPWNLPSQFEVATPLIGEVALTPLRQWVDKIMPVWKARLVGLPVSVFAMTAAEVQALDADSGIVGDLLGSAAEARFLQLRRELAAAGVQWTKRYAARREAWQPFGPGGSTAETTVLDIVREINRQGLAKLRNRQIRAQWYPFDDVLEQASGADLRQRRIYQDVARAGSVLLVDEVSLFHPQLRRALTNSPFFNNDQVAIVTVSPLDPGRAPVDQVLEAEARRQLAGAFTRYANDYDPQCELAVGEERRLRRWLHASLPETVVSLRDPRPDQEAIRAFKDELGAEEAGSGSEYAWAGGGQG